MAKKKSTKSESESTFEQSLASLEQIVRELEDGNLGLTEALEKYESGIGHIKKCHRLLTAAERKIEILTGVGDDGELITESIDETESQEQLDPPAKTSRAKKRGYKSPDNDSDERKIDSLF